MKHQLILALAATALLSLAACSDDDANSISQSTTHATADSGLNIEVAGNSFLDNGTTKAKGDGISTRAFPSNYNSTTEKISTSFSVNDSIGIWEVKDGSVVKTNVKYYFDGKRWNNDSGSVEYDPEATYFAMFPYVPDDSLAKIGAVDASATDSATFFKAIVDNWQPLDDQSDIGNFSYSDLMIAKGTVMKDDGTGEATGSTLTHTIKFTMGHTMTMAIYDMKDLTYLCDVGNDYSTENGYKWIEKFRGYFKGANQPLKWGGYFHFIMRPHTTKTIRPIYSADTFNESAYIIEPGHYALYEVALGYKAFSLKVGDIAYSDGGFSHSGYIAPGKRIIGILAYININGGEDVMEASTYGFKHGLILSRNNFEFKGSDYDDVPVMTILSTNEAATLYNGLSISSSNTAVKAKIEANMGSYTTDFTNGNSGWFIGSVGQYYECFNAIYRVSANDPSASIGAEYNKYDSKKMHQAFEYVDKVYSDNGISRTYSMCNDNAVAYSQRWIRTLTKSSSSYCYVFNQKNEGLDIANQVSMITVGVNETPNNSQGDFVVPLLAF